MTSSSDDIKKSAWKATLHTVDGQQWPSGPGGSFQTLFAPAAEAFWPGVKYIEVMDLSDDVWVLEPADEDDSASASDSDHQHIVLDGVEYELVPVHLPSTFDPETDPF